MYPNNPCGAEGFIQVRRLTYLRHHFHPSLTAPATSYRGSLFLCCPLPLPFARLQSLAEQKGVDVDTSSLDKGSASQKIEELKNASNQSNQSGSTTSSDNKQDAAIDQDPKEWTTGAEAATQKQKGYSAHIPAGDTSMLT